MAVQAKGTSYGQRWTENLTLSNLLILHGIVGPYIFLLYMMFH